MPIATLVQPLESVRWFVDLSFGPRLNPHPSCIRVHHAVRNVHGRDALCEEDAFAGSNALGGRADSEHVAREDREQSARIRAECQRGLFHRSIGIDEKKAAVVGDEAHGAPIAEEGGAPLRALD